MKHILPKASAAVLIATALSAWSTTSAFAFYCDDCYGSTRYYNGTDLYGHVGVEKASEKPGDVKTESVESLFEKSILGDADENSRTFHAGQTSPESTLGSDRDADGRYRR